MHRRLSPSAKPRLAIALATTVAALAASSVVAGPASAVAAGPARQPAAVQALATGSGYAGTIALSNCSGALVRFPTSQSTDRAMMLTNGHCLETGMPSAGQVLVNKATSRTGTLLDAAGNDLGTLRADLMLYGTMTGNDVALYRLTDTFASITSRYGADNGPLTISATHPADGSAITIPSSFWKRTWDCSINGFVPTLREAEWTSKDSIRYNLGCTTIHGSSGTPILNPTTRDVVGINNTGNDDGAMCTLNNPCEVDANGNTTATKGQSYGQQTYWFTTCTGTGSSVNLSKPGCLLTGATNPTPSSTTTSPTSTTTTTAPPTTTTTAPPSGNVLVNPGFESGTTSGWTGTTGPITNNTGRPAHTGTWKLWLGGNATATTETVNQTVTVPTNGKLSFYIRTDTAETGTTVYDTMKAQIVSGGVVSTLGTFTNANTNSTYTLKTYNLASYAGQSVTIRFTSTEDSYLQTSWVIDDASLTS